MLEPSEGSNNSNQINSQNNYKYDQYGFVLVNTIEDLLYDRFNNHMENDYNDNNNKKDKNYNGNSNDLERNSKSIDINKKSRKYNDKSMRLVLKINNKDRKAFRIYPNDSRSIESITLKEKESDIKNNYTKGSSRKKKDLKKYGNKKDENKKSSKKKRKRVYGDNNENNDEFTFCEEENEEDSYNNKSKRKKIMKKKTRKKETESPLEDEEDEEEDDYEEEESDTEINRKKKLGILSRPILSQCIMTKTRMSESENSLVIPKSNMNFITKTYENSGKKKRAKILTWPNSTLCYFYKNNKIIHMNIQIPLHNVVNKNYFCTKQITDTNDKLLLPKTPVSPNVVIKIINPENSPYKYGKINIKARSGKNSSPIQKTYLFKIRGNKPKKDSQDKLSKSNCFKNVEIIKALNKKKKTKTKSKKKKEIISPECIALKRRRKFGDKIYKKMMQKVYPLEYKISIRTKFRNNGLNNTKLLESKKEEEKLLVKNNSMNAYNNIKTNKNIKNIKYPSIRRMFLDENNKNKVPSFIKDPKFNISFQTMGRYNSNNLSQNFPAINSYFH